LETRRIKGSSVRDGGKRWPRVWPVEAPVAVNKNLVYPNPKVCGRNEVCDQQNRATAESPTLAEGRRDTPKKV